MGNSLCCGGSWSCPSTFQNKKNTGHGSEPGTQGSFRYVFVKLCLEPENEDGKHCGQIVKRPDCTPCEGVWVQEQQKGSHSRRPLKQQRQHTQGHESTGHTYERVLQQFVSRQRSQDPKSEESNLHYADIEVCSSAQPRSASEVKHLQLENATEYATLHFPQATPRHARENGTLV
ncbi:uncharacterized protein C11orf52 homolog [Ctenodactylus gundi]